MHDDDIDIRRAAISSRWLLLQKIPDNLSVLQLVDDNLELSWHEQPIQLSKFALRMVFDENGIRLAFMQLLVGLMKDYQKYQQ